MTDAQQISWKRITVEAAAIVASILLAFSIDAWWENRQEREEEQQVLANLYAEFEHNKVELSRTLNSFAEVQRVAEQLLMYAGKNLTDNDEERIEGDINKLYDYFSFDPSSGAVESLLGAGRLDLIMNADLRTRLASWSGRVLEYKEDELWVDQIAYRDLGPILRDLAPYPIIEKNAPGLFDSDWQAAFVDLRFLNMLADLFFWAGETVREGSLLEDELDQIVALLEVELGS